MSELATVPLYETACVHGSEQLRLMETDVLSAFLFFCAGGIRLHLEEGLGHSNQLYLHAHTDKHTHMRVHTDVHTRVHVDMRRHSWNIPRFDLHSSPRIRSFHTLPNVQSLSACTHEHGHILTQNSLSPSRSLRARRALQQGQYLTHRRDCRAMQAELRRIRILIREAIG